ncbi:MAG: hypothetical protein WC028_06500 [Candidatus Obscuribacterales bacterium]
MNRQSNPKGCFASVLDDRQLAFLPGDIVPYRATDKHLYPEESPENDLPSGLAKNLTKNLPSPVQ